MIHYFIQTATGQEGPFTIQELKLKNIKSSTPIWFEGIAGWSEAGQIDALKPVLSVNTPPPFNNSQPPPFDSQEEPRREFRLSLFQWGGIGVVVLAAFMYFAKQGDANTSGNYSAATESIDSTTDLTYAETERQRINAQITAKNTNYRNNWSRFIKAGRGYHKISSLGGVYDLEVVIQNQTDYLLDEVTVAVSYVKDNGGIHKKEIVTIYNVPAGGKASMPAPDSNRGTSVEFEILQISSKKMHFLYSPDIDVQGKDDPYFSRI